MYRIHVFGDVSFINSGNYLLPSTAKNDGHLTSVLAALAENLLFTPNSHVVDKLGPTRPAVKNMLLTLAILLSSV